MYKNQESRNINGFLKQNKLLISMEFLCKQMKIPRDMLLTGAPLYNIV